MPKGDVLWEGDLVYDGDENSARKKFRTKLVYREPNRLNGTTFNWQSEVSQVKLSKFPAKLIKKSDEINGVKVTLKDFIKDSQLLTISDVSPDKGFKDWMQNDDGKFYGFIRPDNNSLTPLVLVQKPKKKGGDVAVFCVETPKKEDKEEGKFKEIGLNEQWKDPEVMFNYFEEAIVNWNLELGTEASSRSDTQSVSHVDEAVTDSGDTGTGPEPSPDKSSSVDKSDMTGPNQNLSTAGEDNLSDSPACVPASPEDIDVAPILERVVDTPSSQTPAQSGDCDQASDAGETIATSNEENNTGDSDNMIDQTKDNLSSVAKDSEQMPQTETHNETQEVTSHLDQPPLSVQCVHDSRDDVLDLMPPPTPAVSEQRLQIETGQDNLSQEDTSHLDQPPLSVQVVHDSREEVERDLMPPPTPSVSEQLPLIETGQEDTSHLDHPPPSVQILEDLMPPATPAVSPPRLLEDQDVPELIPPSPAPPPKIRLRTDLLGPVGQPVDQLSADIQDVLFDEDEEEEEEVNAPEFSQNQQPVIMQQGPPPPGYTQNLQQQLGQLGLGPGVAMQETQVIQTQTRTFMCQPPGPGHYQATMQNQHAVRHRGAVSGHQRMVMQQQAQVPRLRQQLQGIPPNQDCVVPLNPQCRNPNPAFFLRPTGTQGANTRVRYPSGHQVRPNYNQQLQQSYQPPQRQPSYQLPQTHQQQACQRSGHQQQQTQQPRPQAQQHLHLPHPPPQSQTQQPLQLHLPFPGHPRPRNFRPGLPSSRPMDSSQVYVHPVSGVSRQISPPISRSMDSSQVYVHQRQGQQLPQPQQQQVSPGAGPGHLDQRTPVHRAIVTSVSNTGEIVQRKIAANIAFITALWHRSDPNIRACIHKLLSRESQPNESQLLWVMLFQEARKFNLTQEFYRDPDVMEQLRKWYELHQQQTITKSWETWEIEHKVVVVELKLDAAQKAIDFLNTILSKLMVTDQVKALTKALISSDIGVENFLKKVQNQSQDLSRDLKQSLPHLKAAFVQRSINMNSIHPAFSHVNIKVKPFNKAEIDMEKAKLFELLAKRTVGSSRGSTSTPQEKVMRIQDLLKGNLSVEEFVLVLNLGVSQRHKDNVQHCLKHYIMAVFHKQLQAGSLINDLKNLLEFLGSNEKFLIDKRDSLREESERSQFVADLHGALGSNDVNAFFKDYFSDRPELRDFTVEILNRFRTGDLLIPESLRLPTLHLPEETNDEDRRNDDLRTPSPVDNGHCLAPSMPIFAPSVSSMESDRRKNEELLTQANRILRPGLHSSKQEENQFQQHLVSVFQKRKLTLANLKTVKENFLLLVNGGMTLKSFLEQKLLMPEKPNSVFFDAKVKTLELPSKDFVEGLKVGSVQPGKLDWSFNDIIFDKSSGMFMTKSSASRPEEAIKLANTIENQDPEPSARISRTDLFLDFLLLASWEIKAKEKKRSLTAIFTSNMVIFCPKDREFNMDIGHEIKNNMFPDGRSGKLFLPSGEKSEKIIEESFVMVKSLRDFEECFLGGGAETTTVFEIFCFETLSHEYEKKNNSEWICHPKIIHPPQVTPDNCCIKMLNNTFGVPVSKEVTFQRVIEFICPVKNNEIQVNSFAVEMSEFLILFPDETEFRYFHDNVAFGECYNLRICSIGSQSILKFMIPSKLVHATILKSSMLRNDDHLGFIKGKKPFAIRHQDCHIFFSRLPQNRISMIENYSIRKVKSKVECAAKVDLKSSSFFVIYLAPQPPEFSDVRRFIIPVKEGEEICDSFKLSAGIYIEKNQVNTAVVFTVSLPLKTSGFRIEKVQMIKSTPEVSYACNRKESLLTNECTPALFEKMISWTCVHGQKSLKFYHPNIRLQPATPRSPTKSPRRSPLKTLSRRFSNSPMNSPAATSPSRQTESPLARVHAPSPAASPSSTPVSACPSKVTFKVTSAPNLGSPVPVLLAPSSILKRDIVFEVDLYSATPEELYEVPGIDEETARFITESRTKAETFEQFIALSLKHKAVFTENIEFGVGLLGRNKMKLTYRRQPINKYSCKILIKKKKKLEKKAIKTANKKPRYDPKYDLEAQETDPESNLNAEKDDNDERTLTIDEDVHDETITAEEDGVNDETITADEDGVNDETITADEDGDYGEEIAAEEAFQTQQQHQPQQSQIVNPDIMEEVRFDNMTRATATPVTTASTPAAAASEASPTISNPASETQSAPAPSSETPQPVKTSGIVTEGSDKVAALADGSDKKKDSPLDPSTDKTLEPAPVPAEPEVTLQRSPSPSPPEMEATETQTQSAMETSTFPLMTEVETENEDEAPSNPDPADKETCKQTENGELSEQNENIVPDDARINEDVLVPDSIQSVSEKEPEADQIPGETVEPVPEDVINEEEERCMDKSEKSTEEDRVTKELSNEIVIEPVSGPVTSDDDDEDVNDEANFERLKESAEPTENFVEAVSSNEDSDKENNEGYPNVPDVSTLEVGHVLRCSDSANQDQEVPNLLSKEKSAETKRVTPLKLKISKKRKYNQSLSNQSTDEENTEPDLKKVKKKRRKRRKIVKPEETSLKRRQSTLDEHFPKKKATPETNVEDILPMKLFMKPVVRLERSKVAESYQSNNNVAEREFDMSRITHYELFNVDENDPRLELVQIHRPLKFENIRPPKQLEKQPVKKFKCSACGAVFGSWKERKKHYPVHLTTHSTFTPEKMDRKYQCNLCKQCFPSFDKKREHYYDVHASKSTETSQEDNSMTVNDDIGIPNASQEVQSPDVVEPPSSHPNLKSLAVNDRQNARSPVIVGSLITGLDECPLQAAKDFYHSAKNVAELLAEADSEPTKKYDVDNVLKTMENVTCLDLSCDKMFSSKSEMFQHYRSLHVKMSDEEDC